MRVVCCDNGVGLLFLPAVLQSGVAGRYWSRDVHRTAYVAAYVLRFSSVGVPELGGWYARSPSYTIRLVSRSGLSVVMMVGWGFCSCPLRMMSTFIIGLF